MRSSATRGRGMERREERRDIGERDRHRHRHAESGTSERINIISNTIIREEGIVTY